MSSRKLTTADAAVLTGMSEQFIRLAAISKLLPWAKAVQAGTTGRHTFHYNLRKMIEEEKLENEEVRAYCRFHGIED